MRYGSPYQNSLCTDKGEFILKSFDFYNNKTKKMESIQANQQFRLFYHGIWNRYVDDIFDQK